MGELLGNILTWATDVPCQLTITTSSLVLLTLLRKIIVAKIRKTGNNHSHFPLDFLRSRHPPLTISWSQRDPSASKRAGVTIWDERSLGRNSQWISNIQKPVKHQLSLHHRERESWLKSASRNFHCMVGASDLGGNIPAPRNLS